MVAMNTTNDVRARHHAEIDAGEELIAVTGGGLRIAEICLVVFLGLLVCPPLLILAVVVAAPLLAAALVIGAVVAAIAVPTWLVRKVRAHHREHGTTMFLHRLRPS
jgi:hypothetical protein